MGESEWTIERELCKLIRVDSPADALFSLGLLSSTREPFQLKEVHNWFRSGAETYLYSFIIERESSEPIHLALKACVAHAPGSSINKIIEGWVSRRTLLTTKGITAPILYYHGEGVLVEEFIPFSLKELLEGRSEVPRKILFDLVKFARLIDDLGFLPIDLFGDLRSHGEDVVVVDFGSDLGPPGQSARGSARSLDKLLSYLRGLSIDLPSEALTEIGHISTQPN